MGEIKKTNERNTMTILNPVELIKWCKNRKATLGLSNAKLAEMSGVPIGTIDRIMSGNYTEFKYSSIQPLVAILLGFGQETPEPDEENEQEQFYYETIEGYKIILENKNSEIRHYKASLEHVENEVNYLRQENASKKELLDRMSEHITWLEQFINKNDIK